MFTLTFKQQLLCQEESGQKGTAMITTEELELTMIEIVALSGDARTKLLSAVKEAKSGDFDRAHALVAEARGLLGDAHKSQTDLLTAEARGELTTPTVLLVHAQDHLMTSMLLRDVIDALIDIYR